MKAGSTKKTGASPTKKPSVRRSTSSKSRRKTTSDVQETSPTSASASISDGSTVKQLLDTSAGSQLDPVRLISDYQLSSETMLGQEGGKDCSVPMVAGYGDIAESPFAFQLPDLLDAAPGMKWQESGRTRTTDSSCHESSAGASDDLESRPPTVSESLSGVESSCGVTKRTKGISHARKRAPGHIPRPRNAFILFRSHALANGLVPLEGVADHQQVSRIVGQIWSSLPPEDKKEWQLEAQKEKEEHKRLYPDYQYKPDRPRNKPTKRTKRQPDDEEKAKEAADSILRAHGRDGVRQEVDLAARSLTSPGSADAQRIFRRIRAKAMAKKGGSSSPSSSSLHGSSASPPPLSSLADQRRSELLATGYDNFGALPSSWLRFGSERRRSTSLPSGNSPDSGYQEANMFELDGDDELLRPFYTSDVFGVWQERTAQRSLAGEASSQSLPTSSSMPLSPKSKTDSLARLTDDSSGSYLSSSLGTARTSFARPQPLALLHHPQSDCADRALAMPYASPTDAFDGMQTQQSSATRMSFSNATPRRSIFQREHQMHMLASTTLSAAPAQATAPSHHFGAPLSRPRTAEDITPRASSFQAAAVEGIHWSTTAMSDAMLVSPFRGSFHDVRRPSAAIQQASITTSLGVSTSSSSTATASGTGESLTWGWQSWSRASASADVALPVMKPRKSSLTSLHNVMEQLKNASQQQEQQQSHHLHHQQQQQKPLRKHRLSTSFALWSPTTPTFRPRMASIEELFPGAGLSAATSRSRSSTLRSITRRLSSTKEGDMHHHLSLHHRSDASKQQMEEHTFPDKGQIDIQEDRRQQPSTSRLHREGSSTDEEGENTFHFGPEFLDENSLGDLQTMLDSPTAASSSSSSDMPLVQKQQKRQDREEKKGKSGTAASPASCCPEERTTPASPASETTCGSSSLPSSSRFVSAFESTFLQEPPGPPSLEEEPADEALRRVEQDQQQQHIHDDQEDAEMLNTFALSP